MDPIDWYLTELAERQHGLVARRQAIDRGITPGAWLHRMGGPDWAPVNERVARRTGAPRTALQGAMAAVLDVGDHTFVSHGPAAAVWGHPAFARDAMEVMTLRPRSSRTQRGNLAIVHHPRHLPDPFAACVQGIAVARPALVLLQMAPRLHPQRLRRLLDWFWNRRLLSGPSARRELEPLLTRGRPGVAALRQLFDSLPADYVPPASNLEARVARILADHGLPAMRRQVDLGGEERWSGRVDLVAVGLPLVVEVDSEMYHSALTDTEADERRQARLEDDGFTVVRVEDTVVWTRPDEVARRVRAGLREVRVRRRAA